MTYTSSTKRSRTARQFAKDATDDADKAYKAAGHGEGESLYLLGRAVVNGLAAIAVAIDRLAAAVEKAVQKGTAD